MNKNKRQNFSRKSKNRKGMRVALNKQPKFTDLAFGATVSTIAAQAGLVAVTQGVDILNRIGKRIYPRNLAIKATFTASTALVGTTASAIRFLIVQDLQQIPGTSPAISDVINPATVEAQRNFMYLSRFRIIRDIKVKVDTYNPTVIYTDNIKLNGVIEFASPLATDWSKNGIFLMYVSNNSVNPPTMAWSSRLQFD